MTRIAYLLLSLLLFQSVNAADYYVDFDSGSDANAGTSTGAAWKHSPDDVNATGTADATTLVAGDTIIFKGGVDYMGKLVIAASGSSGNVITYDGTGDSWGSGRAVIDADYEQDAQIITLSSGVSHIAINGFELRNAGGYAEDDPIVLENAAMTAGEFDEHSEWLAAENTPLWGYGVLMSGSNTYVTLDDLYIHNIGVWYSTIGWSGNGTSGTGIYMSTPSNVTISNCEITKAGATAIGLYSGGTTQNVTIEDCYIHDDIPAWGIDVAPIAVGATFENILITRTRLIDLWSDWSGTPDDPPSGYTAPHQNYIFFRTATNTSTWTNLEVSRCMFTETSDTHTGLGGTGSIFISNGPSVNIHNNVFARPWSYTGIIVIGYDVPATITQTIQIYNNTFFRGSGAIINSSGVTRDEARFLYIENNIFINDSGLAANNAMVISGGVYNDPQVMNNNVYYSLDWSAAQMFIGVFSGYKTLSTLQTYGFEATGQYGNPNLEDVFNEVPASRDFRPSETAIGNGEGTDLSAYFTVDYLGNTRSAWDVGAYEYGSAGPTTLPKQPTGRSRLLLAN